jgi:hypothetical protein
MCCLDVYKRTNCSIDLASLGGPLSGVEYNRENATVNTKINKQHDAFTVVVAMYAYLTPFPLYCRSQVSGDL